MITTDAANVMDKYASSLGAVARGSNTYEMTTNWESLCALSTFYGASCMHVMPHLKSNALQPAISIHTHTHTYRTYITRSNQYRRNTYEPGTSRMNLCTTIVDSVLDLIIYWVFFSSFLTHSFCAHIYIYIYVYSWKLWYAMHAFTPCSINPINTGFLLFNRIRMIKTLFSVTSLSHLDIHIHTFDIRQIDVEWWQSCLPYSARTHTLPDSR